MLKYKENLVNEISNVTKLISEKNEINLTEISIINEKLKKMEIQISTNSEKITENNFEISFIKNTVLKDFEESVEQKRKKFNDFIDQKFVKISDKLADLINSQQNTEKTLFETDFYLSKVLPLKTQTQIFSAFYECFPQKFLSKMQNCETIDLEKYQEKIKSDLQKFNKKYCEIPVFEKPEISKSALKSKGQSYVDLAGQVLQKNIENPMEIAEIKKSNNILENKGEILFEQDKLIEMKNNFENQIFENKEIEPSPIKRNEEIYQSVISFAESKEIQQKLENESLVNRVESRCSKRENSVYKRQINIGIDKTEIEKIIDEKILEFYNKNKEEYEKKFNEFNQNCDQYFFIQNL